MILYAASAVIFLFVAFSLFWHSDCRMAVKAIGTLLILLVSLKFEIYQFLGGAFFAPQLPRVFLLVMEALYGALIILFFLLLLPDLHLACSWIMGRAGLPIPRHFPYGLIKCGLVALALGAGIWGTWQAVKVPDVRNIELQVADLPAALEGVSLVQLTDLHIGPILRKDWLAEVVARTNALKPDMIVLTGDYVDGYAREIGHELEPLAALNARCGVWAVTGNHEYYWNMPEWRSVLEKLNVNILENRYHAIAVNNETIVVAGIPDLAAERFGLAMPDLAKALDGAPKALRILLSHQPRHGREYTDKVDIVLSGHTHGGLMFFLQPLIARFNAGFVAGLYPVDGKNIYVSRGTALWNGLSCRIGVPSEITRFVLKKGGETNSMALHLTLGSL